MNRSGIEKAIRNTVNSAPGLTFGKLAAMPYIKLAEQDYITKQKPNDKINRTRQFSLAAACCLVLIVFLSGWYIRNRVPDSIITLDVNPSIEIRTNLKNEILSVRAINEDANGIINNKDYKGDKLEAVVPLLMNSLVERNYINTEHNAILLTVTNRSSHKADSVMKKVDSKIRESLLALNITPTILNQRLAKETERARLAGQYGLSEGKLNLILDIIAGNSDYTLEELAGKSILQLLVIAKANSVDLSKYFSQEDNTGSGNNPGNIKEDAGETKDTEEPVDREDSYLEEGNSKEDTGESKDNEDLNKEENNDDGLNDGSQDNKENQEQDVSRISEDTEEEDNRKEDAAPVSNEKAHDYNDDRENSDENEDSYINNDRNSDNDSEDSYSWKDNSDTSSEDSYSWKDNSDTSSGDSYSWEDNSGTSSGDSYSREDNSGTSSGDEDNHGEENDD